MVSRRPCFEKVPRARRSNLSRDFRLGDDGVYRCQAFEAFPWQQHGFGTRLANPGADVTLRQIHSNIVWNAAGLADRQREGDALVTDCIRQSIAIRTADCVPLLILDDHRRAVAAVHAGWRGTAAEIAKATVRKLETDFATAPPDLHVAIGPCIRGCCYEVGADVARQFAPYFPEWNTLVSSRKIDLAEANRRQLQSVGVPSAHIFDSGFCTACGDGHFFSYRQDPNDPGRMLAAISRLA